MKNILIIGGANGIGLSIANEFLKEGGIEHIYRTGRPSLAGAPG